MLASGTINIRARAFRRAGRVLALACTLGLPASASAQRLQFSKITADDGLAGPWVASIYQDSRGFMWFGTRRGLDRFDGYTIRNFRKIRGDSTSIGNNYINFVAEDRDSVLWVGTRTGVSRYDRAHETFSTYQVDGERQVLCMLHAKNGTLWFGGDNGLYRFDRSTGKGTRYAGSSSIAGKTIQVITEDRRGHLWIGTKENGVVDLDVASGNARLYPGSLGAASGLPDGDTPRPGGLGLADRGGPGLGDGPSPRGSGFPPRSRVPRRHLALARRERQGPDRRWRAIPEGQQDRDGLPPGAGPHDLPAVTPGPRQG